MTGKQQRHSGIKLCVGLFIDDHRDTIIDTSTVEMKRFFLDVVQTGEELGVIMPCLSVMKEKITE